MLIIWYNKAMKDYHYSDQGDEFMNISGLSSYYSNWFNNLYNGSTSGNSTSDLMSLMKQVDTVRSPDYKKQIKAEYNKLFSESDSDVGTVASEQKLSAAAKELTASAEALSSFSRSDFDDTDKLVSAVTAFADDFNSTVDALQKSDSVDALRSGIQMTNSAKTYSGALSRIGIKVGSDNKITVDEEALKAADKNVVSSIFKGSYSVASKIAGKASDVSKAAANKAQTTAYTQSGKISDFSNVFIGSFLDSYM